MTTLNHRLQSIDALRGLVILIMLLDHVRETFFLHRQVLDPMDVEATEPSLFISRSLAHLCAPVFIFLTGLSAFLYGYKKGGTPAAAGFLFKRGLFLIVLELTLVNFAWTFTFPPATLYLQVIWAIGLSMIALSLLSYLPRPLLIAVGLIIVGGHNLLDHWHFDQGSPFHGLWAILHDRGWLTLGEHLRLRTSYPILPWIGVIALGYAAGPWFTGAPEQRQQRLLYWGGGALALFVVLRLINGYGEKPWVIGSNLTASLMSFFNITKYPPSLLFIAITLGTGLLLLRYFERTRRQHLLKPLATFGSAPMFFYLLHLYVLKLLYLACLAVWGANQGDWFGFTHIWQIWLCTLLLAVLLYYPVKRFSTFKASRRDIAWLKYL